MISYSRFHPRLPCIPRSGAVLVILSPGRKSTCGSVGVCAAHVEKKKKKKKAFMREYYPTLEKKERKEEKNKTDGRLLSAHHDTIPHIHRDLPAPHSNTTPWQRCGKLCSSLPPMTQSWIPNQNYLETTLWSYWSPVGRSFTQFFT